MLHEEPGARPAGRHAGLYHFALLYPSREALARALARLAVTRTPIDGASFHGISEAIYLPDPDGNGIELAADLPREEWPEEWDVRPQPLDLEASSRLVAGEQPAAPRGSRPRGRPPPPARRRHRARRSRSTATCSAST